MVMATSTKQGNLHVRLSDAEKDRLTAALESKRVTQQNAIRHLVLWALDQDTLTQSLLFGQIPEDCRGQIARLMLDRMAEPSARPRVGIIPPSAPSAATESAGARGRQPSPKPR